MCPHSLTGRPYHPNGLGRAVGTRVYPPLSGSGWTLCLLHLRGGVPIPQAAQAGPEGLGCIHRCVGVAGPCAYLVLPRGALIPQTAQAGPEGLGCIRRCVRVAGPCVSSLSHGAPVFPQRPRHDRGDSGLSAAVQGWLDLVSHRSPTASRYPPSGRGRAGGTRVYPPLWEGGWALCIPCFPTGRHYPRAAQAGPQGLGCIRRCVGGRRWQPTSVPTGRPYPPSGLSSTGGTRMCPPLCGSGWALCKPCSPPGRPYPPHGPGMTGGTRVYPPLCGSGWALCIPCSPTAHASPPNSPCRTGATRVYPPWGATTTGPNVTHPPSYLSKLRGGGSPRVRMGGGFRPWGGGPPKVGGLACDPLLQHAYLVGGVFGGLGVRMYVCDNSVVWSLPRNVLKVALLAPPPLLPPPSPFPPPPLFPPRPPVSL